MRSRLPSLRLMMATLLAGTLLFAGCKNAERSQASTGTPQAEPGNGGVVPMGSARAASAGESGPLAPLTPIGKQLNDGMAAFLDGTNPSAAFPKWDVTADKADALRAALRAAGATNVSVISAELEFIFRKADGDYYVRTGVFMNDAAASFVHFEGREEKGGVHVRSVSMNDLTGPAEPFKLAAEGLLRSFSGQECAMLPFVTDERISTIAASGKLADELKRDVAKSRTNLSTVCGSIAALGHVGPDNTRVRVDDVGYFAKSSDGTVLGVVKAQFEVRQPGKLAFSLGTFRARK